MMVRTSIGSLSFVILFALVAGMACAQPSDPSPELKIFQKELGAWDADVKIWPQPGVEPMVSRGKENNEMLGGTWFVSKFAGKFGDLAFTGIGTIGYDPVEKKYVGTWVDTVSPFLTEMKGDYDPATKSLTMIAEGRDFASLEMMKTTQVTRFIDENTREFEISATGPDGKPWKMMEIKYKRSK